MQSDFFCEQSLAKNWRFLNNLDNPATPFFGEPVSGWQVFFYFAALVTFFCAFFG